MKRRCLYTCEQILLDRSFIKTIYYRCCDKTEDAIELQNLLRGYGILIPKFDSCNPSDPVKYEYGL